MPMIYPCANIYCDGTTGVAGTLCQKCQKQQPTKQQKPSEKTQRWSLWNRHKGDVRNKHQRTEAEE